MGALNREYEFYLKHKQSLLKEHSQKFVVIKKDNIIGIYDDPDEAFNKTVRKHKFGTFLIQQVLEKEPLIEVC